jgi:hypothetical protein
MLAKSPKLTAVDINSAGKNKRKFMLNLIPSFIAGDFIQCGNLTIHCNLAHLILK